MSPSVPVVVGLDIGYSNCKVVFGDIRTEPRVLVAPVGAAPVKRKHRDLLGQSGHSVEVLVDGEPWAAMASPDDFAGGRRKLDRSYHWSDQYKAVFHAALLKTEAEQVDCLVTGLPTTHMKDAPALQEMMLGDHFVSADRCVSVRNVLVVPQPVGAFVAHCQERSWMPTDRYRTLVVDPGFFSVDWVLLKGSSIVEDSSDSSVQATSRVLERAAEIIGVPSITARLIEERLQTGDYRHRVGREFVDVREAVREAGLDVAPGVAEAVCARLRGETVDSVLVAGGGADFYLESMQKTLQAVCGQYLEVERIAEPVSANARGFFSLARGKARKLRAAA